MGASAGADVAVPGGGKVAGVAVGDCVGADVMAGVAAVPKEATPPCPRQAPLRRALEYVLPSLHVAVTGSWACEANPTRVIAAAASIKRITCMDSSLTTLIADDRARLSNRTMLRDWRRVVRCRRASHDHESAPAQGIQHMFSCGIG